MSKKWHKATGKAWHAIELLYARIESTEKERDDRQLMVDQYADLADRFQSEREWWRASFWEKYDKCNDLQDEAVDLMAQVEYYKGQVDRLLKLGEQQLEITRKAVEEKNEVLRQYTGDILGGTNTTTWKDRHDEEHKRRVYWMNMAEERGRLMNAATTEIEQLNKEISRLKGVIMQDVLEG